VKRYCVICDHTLPPRSRFCAVGWLLDKFISPPRTTCTDGMACYERYRKRTRREWLFRDGHWEEMRSRDGRNRTGGTDSPGSVGQDAR
jgi:hypothetical protein